MMDEERLREFKPVAPPPGLKERVLGAARTAPKPGLIDRLWTRKTWAALAAAFLGALALYALSVRPVRLDPGLPMREVRRAIQTGERIVERDRRERALNVMEARALNRGLLEDKRF